MPVRMVGWLVRRAETTVERAEVGERRAEPALVRAEAAVVRAGAWVAIGDELVERCGRSGKLAVDTVALMGAAVAGGGAADGSAGLAGPHAGRAGTSWEVADRVRGRGAPVDFRVVRRTSRLAAKEVGSCRCGPGSTAMEVRRDRSLTPLLRYLFRGSNPITTREFCYKARGVRSVGCCVSARTSKRTRHRGTPRCCYAPARAESASVTTAASCARNRAGSNRSA